MRHAMPFLVMLLLGAPTWAAEPIKKPNIVWIFVDDMSANFSCYGEKLIATPHVDQLAAEGVKFTKAFVTAPVCSPCRSALMTGCYQTTIGSHHHRSGRGVEKITLPTGIVPVPKLFHDAGYYTCIGGPLVKGKAKLAKTDYNFEWDENIYDSNDWAGRKAGQPFFMQVQLHGGKYRGQKPNPNFEARATRELDSRVKPAEVTLPPYYPRDPVLLKDWADYLDCCRITDNEVGEVVARLKKENILDETIVFFMTDHGISHARGKQFLYDHGTHVPFVVRGPGLGKDVVREDLVEHIDMTATSLAIAGIAIPSWMQGRDIFANNYKPREAVFAARDRCDETIDHIRSVRTQNFKYIRNYLNERPLLQPCQYKDDKAILQRLRELHKAGELNALQEKLLFSPQRPREELYDLRADPDEINNLAGDPTHANELAAMRQRLTDWEERTQDKGRTPEPWTMYDSDMAVYLNAFGRQADRRAGLQHNIDLNKAWAKDGK